MKSAAYGVFLITSKVLDARRRGATTEPYGVIGRKPVESLQVEREERSKATVPFDFAQDREPVERQMMSCWWIRVPVVACLVLQKGVDCPHMRFENVDCGFQILLVDRVASSKWN